MSEHGFRSFWRLLHAHSGFYQVVQRMAFLRVVSLDKLIAISSVLPSESLCLVLQFTKPALLDLWWIIRYLLWFQVIPGLERNHQVNSGNVAGVCPVPCLGALWWMPVWRLVLDCSSSVLLLGPCASQPDGRAVWDHGTPSPYVRLSAAVLEQKTACCHALPVQLCCLHWCSALLLPRHQELPTFPSIAVKLWTPVWWT